ncbi:hypothetical protein OHD62_17410 [Mesorhizobium sp. YC-39]|uniref:hypothetical protein n=1 Tax=unclassified Mesorhizobium TaxID=325217 RepID=UPI0021E99A9E|nr:MULTISPECIES: hypothetical protein [unclassified Mesorhizobium]MCV3209622.1 hypothetical protein [Mesorhizobium sp. YC-2]MCV3230152.1 hypothetical protein [Mesorhizobium sp. YC-39]
MTHSNDALDPFVRRMRDAESDAARAAVLLEAPVFTLMRWRQVFDLHCRRAAFGEGADYLAALAETLSKPRHRGNLTGTMPMAGAHSTLLNVLDGGGGS